MFKRILWHCRPKTVTLGLYKSSEEYRRAIEAKGYFITVRACKLLDKIPLAPEKTDLDLMIISGAKLGIKWYETLENFYGRIREFGLELCPAEVAPAFRLAYPDLKGLNVSLDIAMETVAIQDDDPQELRMFTVGGPGSPQEYLGTDWDTGHMRPGKLWVFPYKRRWRSKA